MEERMDEMIERVEAIFGELGYDIFDRESTEDMYQASFGKDEEITGTVFIENESSFMEMAYSYVFDREEETFLKENLESMMNICYEYGIYFNITREEDEITFSIFSKVYYSGFNVESLHDTIEDFKACNNELVSVFNLEEDDNFSEDKSNH